MRTQEGNEEEDFATERHYDLVEVKESNVAGKGLFAAQDISKGTFILPYIGPLICNEDVAALPQEKLAFLFAYDDQKVEPSIFVVNLTLR